MRTVPGWLPVLILTLAMLLWGSSFIALKLAFAHLDPMVVIFGRMAMASVCFLLWGGPLRPMVWRKQDIKYLLFMVLCEPCLYFLFEAKAIELTSASQAGMITALLPMMVAVTAHIYLKEPLNRRALWGCVLAILGACGLSLGGQPSAAAPNPLLGNFLEFVAMVCATGYIITLKRLTARYSPFVLTALQALAGSLFYAPFLLLPSTRLPTQFEPVATLAVVYLGTFVTLGAYGLYNFGVSRLPVSQASVFVNLIPVFAVLLGWLVLGESLTPAQCMASGLVLIGVGVVQQAGTGPRPVIQKQPI